MRAGFRCGCLGKTSALDIVHPADAGPRCGLAAGGSIARCDGRAVRRHRDRRSGDGARRRATPRPRNPTKRAARVHRCRPLRAFRWLHSFSSITRHAPLTTSETAPRPTKRNGGRSEREDAAQEDGARGRRSDAARHRCLARTSFRQRAARHPRKRRQRTDVAAPPRFPRAAPACAARENAAQGADAVEPIGRLVDRVRGADLGDGVRLIGVPESARVSEFEFQLPVESVSLDDVA